jgi:hypothetical protein
MTTLAKAENVGEILRGPDIPAKPNDLLVSILRTRRSHGSVGDTNFRLWLNQKLKSYGAKPEIVVEGNIVVVTDAKSDTLFSCHIDTCHSKVESNGQAQDLSYDPSFGHIVLDKSKDKPGVLGADDGAGIYIMLRMIEKKVPGTYIFHVGEECGGVGSRAYLQKSKDKLEQFSRAIAFDRACHAGNEPEVICTQGGQACASIEFGKALVAELNKHSHKFSNDWVVSHKGTFTDTKVYRGVINECVNLSVFYANQHSDQEYLDVSNLESLVDVACSIKWDDLPTVRKPEDTPIYQHNAWKNKPALDMYGYGDLSYDKYKAPKDNKKKAKKPTLTPVSPTLSLMDEVMMFNLEELETMCVDSSETMARLMAKLIAKNQALELEVQVLSTYLDT